MKKVARRKTTKIDVKNGVVTSTINDRRRGYYGVGKARLNKSAGDIFNEDFGVELSKKKALESFQRSKLVKYRRKIEALQHEIEMYNKLINTTESIRKELLEEIETLKK